MDSEKFTNTSLTIKGLLGLIEANDIAIPEIQRPFVWKNTQVRDLIDSLYKGYPTGYIILWKNPNVKLKDGTISSGKKIIIDGQQRITALMTAIASKEVFNSNFKKNRVAIAFNPFAALDFLNGNSEAEIFEVQTPAHKKSKNWIPDIAEIFKRVLPVDRRMILGCVADPLSRDQLRVEKVVDGLLDMEIIRIFLADDEFRDLSVRQREGDLSQHVQDDKLV